MRLLIIEDDAPMARAVTIGLERRSYNVRTAGCGAAGLRLVAEWQPDLILLDVMMPSMDGWEVCRRLREGGADTPVIMLTAKGAQADVIQGLSHGADDYVKKPFDMNELALRIAAVLHRTRPPDTVSATTLFDDGHLRIDLDHRVVLRGGQPVHLTPTEYRLLSCLVRQTGRLVMHQELLREAWGAGCSEETANLAVYIRYLREKLEESPANPQYIRTEWGTGYRFGRAPGEPALKSVALRPVVRNSPADTKGVRHAVSTPEQERLTTF